MFIFDYEIAGQECSVVVEFYPSISTMFTDCEEIPQTVESVWKVTPKGFPDIHWPSLERKLTPEDEVDLLQTFEQEYKRRWSAAINKTRSSKIAQE